MAIESDKTFRLSWGRGRVLEEAQCTGRYRRPTIQLLEFDEGDCAGQRQIRFCQYTSGGAFSRFSLILDPSDIPGLRRAIRKCPALHKLLARLV